MKSKRERREAERRALEKVKQVRKEGFRIKLTMDTFLNDDPELLVLMVTRNGSHWQGFDLYEDELPKLLKVIRKYLKGRK